MGHCRREKDKMKGKNMWYSPFQISLSLNLGTHATQGVVQHPNYPWISTLFSDLGNLFLWPPFYVTRPPVSEPQSVRELRLTLDLSSSVSVRVAEGWRVHSHGLSWWLWLGSSVPSCTVPAVWCSHASVFLGCFSCPIFPSSPTMPINSLYVSECHSWTLLLATKTLTNCTSICFAFSSLLKLLPMCL